MLIYLTSLTCLTLIALTLLILVPLHTLEEKQRLLVEDLGLRLLNAALRAYTRPSGRYGDESGGVFCIGRVCEPPIHTHTCIDLGRAIDQYWDARKALQDIRYGNGGPRV